MEFRTFLVLLALFSSSTFVRADTLYKCVDSSGVMLYTNQKVDARKCTVVSSDQPVSTFSAPKPPPRTATPSDFPRVNGDTQRGRDSDRRKILEQELATEQQNLDKARKALAEAEAGRTADDKSYQRYLDRAPNLRDGITLHERNIEALRQELANLR